MCGPDAVPALLDLIRNDRHAFAAQDALSIMDTEVVQVIDLLLPVLSDDRESPRVRVAVAEALRMLGKNDVRVFQCLATVLSDADEVESVRLAAARGLRDSSAGDWTALFQSVAHDPSLVVALLCACGRHRPERTNRRRSGCMFAVRLAPSFW